MQEKKVYRHELKYFMNYKKYNYLKNLFQMILTKDDYTNESGDYWIRSLYFDTNMNSDYLDKEIGIKNRKKIRMRIYDTSSQVVKLEVKNRNDQYMLKETLTITKDDALKLIDCNYEVLLMYETELARRIYAIMKENLYRPVIIIDYEREAYLYPINNIRITFDKNVRASEDINEFFNNELNTIKIFNEPSTILEVKYNHALPNLIREVLSVADGCRSSISKYCLGRQLIK